MLVTRVNPRIKARIGSRVARAFEPAEPRVISAVPGYG